MSLTARTRSCVRDMTTLGPPQVKNNALRPVRRSEMSNSNLSLTTESTGVVTVAASSAKNVSNAKVASCLLTEFAEF